MRELKKKLAFEIRNSNLEIGESDLDVYVQTALDAYETARGDGLCHEGAWEVAISAARSVNGKRPSENKT